MLAFSRPAKNLQKEGALEVECLLKNLGERAGRELNMLHIQAGNLVVVKKKT